MHRWKILLALAASAPALNGCVPVVAAGAGTAVLVAQDRRTTGIYFEDENIELKIKRMISEQYGDKVHADVTSFNRVVLLTGQIADQISRDGAANLARGIENVRVVQNELVVSRLSDAGARTNDAYLAGKVKARFASEQKFQPNHVKVVTENGAVYLMGLVSRKEAEDATQIASTTTGVKKVVRVFEYVD